MNRARRMVVKSNDWKFLASVSTAAVTDGRHPLHSRHSSELTGVLIGSAADN